jgi:hypothetical protein
MMSACDSMPTDKRSNPSVMPRDSRTSTGMEPCVIVTGWHASDSTPPKLSASEKSCNLDANAFVLCGPPRNTIDTMPPKPRICRFAKSCCGCDGRPG